jgi:YidC/Oxa1 family membrane protein insertase
MQEYKPMILAMILSVLVVVGWDYFYQRPRVVAANRPAAVLETEAPAPKLERLASLEATKAQRITVLTHRLRGSIYLMGGRFDDLLLTEYSQEQTAIHEPVVLLSPANTEHPYYVQFGWLTHKRSLEMPGPLTLWTTKDKVLRPDQPVTLEWTNPEGVTFSRHLEIDDHAMITIKETVKNHAGYPIQLAPFGMIVRGNVPPLASSALTSVHHGPIGVMQDGLEEMSYTDLTESNPTKEWKDTVAGWLGFSDHYWLTAMIPDRSTHHDVRFKFYRTRSDAVHQVDFSGHMLSMDPEAEMTIQYRLFAGPKKISILDQYRKHYEIPKFDRAIDFGWFYFLTKPLLLVLKFFHRILGNVGWAIIAATVVVRVALFPLTMKSHQSMYRMRKIQPEIERLRAQYGTDKLRFNQELMKFYQRQGVNPMAGCLPMILQIPIMLALYKVLFVAIEIRHAPFVGWITDLSAPDPTSVLNLFGLAPWSVPDLFRVGVWPILMTVTMALQQRLSPRPTDPLQAKMMDWMPWMLLILFYNLPAGLIIYWTVSNLLGIAQQWWVNRRLSTQENFVL